MNKLLKWSTYTLTRERKKVCEEAKVDFTYFKFMKATRFTDTVANTWPLLARWHVHQKNQTKRQNDRSPYWNLRMCFETHPHGQQIQKVMLVLGLRFISSNSWLIWGACVFLVGLLFFGVCVCVWDMFTYIMYNFIVLGFVCFHGTDEGFSECRGPGITNFWGDLNLLNLLNLLDKFPQFSKRIDFLFYALKLKISPVSPGFS